MLPVRAASTQLYTSAQASLQASKTKLHKPVLAPKYHLLPIISEPKDLQRLGLFHLESKKAIVMARSSVKSRVRCPKVLCTPEKQKRER